MSHRAVLFSGESAISELNDWLSDSSYSQYVLLSDSNTAIHCIPRLREKCSALSDAIGIQVGCGESNKNLRSAESIWQRLLDISADRDALLINVGGGLITDLGGFAASVYKRGISFVNVPTSVLAMADAAVGGKTGIDYRDYKNVIGTFAQPAAICLSPQWLDTLPAAEHTAGMAEVYKIAIVCDAVLWRELSDGPADAFSSIRKAFDHKVRITAEDPFETGIRKWLNFGHTAAHAIESVFLARQRAVRHGDAVAAGMIIESIVAEKKKMIAQETLSGISRTIKTHLAPVSLVDFDAHQLIAFIRNDKKSQRGRNRLSLPAGIGACKPDVEVSDNELIDAFTEYSNAIGD